MVSSYHSERAGATRFDLCLAPFLQTPGLPFADVLSEEQIQEAFAAEGISLGESEGTVYTPAVTLWAFLSQMIHTDQLRSCPAAVARVVVLLTALGRKPCSADTAANPQAYPQSKAQKPGLGFPLLRMMVVLSLATAALCAVDVAPFAGKKTGESTLLRGLLGSLHPGEILVGDRACGNYFLIALGLKHGVDWLTPHAPGAEGE